MNLISIIPNNDVNWHTNLIETTAKKGSSQ